MFESIFDGLMLGDGYLRMKKGSRNAIYGHSCKEYEYIEWLVNCITDSNFNHNHKIYKKDNGYNTGVVYQFYTRVSPWLTEQYRRWYPDGKKSCSSLQWRFGQKIYYVIGILGMGVWTLIRII